MIVKASDADRFATRPPPGIAAVLFYGPDQGLVRERAEACAKSVVPDLTDPFRISEFSDGALESDPARLFDEAAAISMLGGRRVLRVRGAGKLSAEIIETERNTPVRDVYKRHGFSELGGGRFELSLEQPIRIPDYFTVDS